MLEGEISGEAQQARSFYDRKRKRTDRPLATKALAHNLARACYYILRDQNPIDAHLCFGWQFGPGW